MKKKIVSTLLCAAMVATMMTGCGNNAGASTNAGTSDAGSTSDAGTADAETGDTAATEASSEAGEDENQITGDASAADAFVVWGWNDDIKKILDTVFKEAYPEDYERIVFVNTGGSDNYQTKIDGILDDTSNELYPDMMGLETDYVLKYVYSDYLISVADCGIEAADYANQYQYNIDKGTDADGKVKALFWQATPGCFQLRADLCEKYLGTTDQAELESMFSSWDSILDTARSVNEASGGKCKLFSGYDEMFRVLQNSSELGWYDANDVIQVDDNMTQYMELAKTCYDEELTYNTAQWGTDWYANMDGDGETTNAAIAYCGCPWFTYWSLSDTWKGNTICVAAPEQFYWGGTGLAATAGCTDTELAGKILECLTCNTDTMVKINAQNSDFVNNTEAIQIISDNGAKCEYIYGDQDIMAFYKPMAENISATNATAEDQSINSAWASQVDAYAAGEKDMDTAIADFKAAVHDTFSYLKVE